MPQRLHRRPSRQRGQVLIIVGLSLAVLIGAAGLAIDAGRAYGVKARLNAAIDATAIAAARALAVGDDDATRRANAQATGLRFFQMNYPDGFLGSTPSAPTITAVHEDTGYWRVNVSGSASVPTTLLRVIGTDAMVAPSAAGEAIRRDLDVILVMDTSGSLNSPSSAFGLLKNAAINNFVSKFAAGRNGDRLGLVTFASGAVLDEPIDKTATRGFNRTVVEGKIRALTAEGATASAEGMRIALEELEAIPTALQSSLRVILFFSDGAPNLIRGEYYRQDDFTRVDGNLYSETSNTTLSRNFRSGGRNYTAYCSTSTASGNGVPCRIFPSNRRSGTEVRHFATIRDASNTSIPLPSPPSPPSPHFYPGITHLPANGYGNFPLSGRRALTNAPSPARNAMGNPIAGFPFDNTYCNMNKAARNMIENVATAARQKEIRVYTVGLGDALQSLETSFSGGNCGYTTATEKGEVLLKRLANTRDSTNPDPNQPEGMYCWAQNAAALGPCFDKIASEILRLTM